MIILITGTNMAVFPARCVGHPKNGGSSTRGVHVYVPVLIVPVPGLLVSVSRPAMYNFDCTITSVHTGRLEYVLRVYTRYAYQYWIKRNISRPHLFSTEAKWKRKWIFVKTRKINEHA